MSESRDPAGDSTTTNNMGEVREAEHQGAAVKAALGANIGVAIAKLSRRSSPDRPPCFPSRYIPSRIAPTKSY